MDRRELLATVVALVVVAGAVACTPTDVAERRCRDEARPLFTIESDQQVAWPSSSLVLENGTTVDAAGRTFVHDIPNGRFRVGIKVHRPNVAGSQRMDLCIVGGSAFTTLDPERTPFDTWHDTYAAVQENPNPVFVGTRIFNTGDGFVFSHLADNWMVVGTRADGGGVFGGAYIHDDCIQNDSMLGGVVLDAKFDGCMVFLSATTGQASVDPPDGSGKQVVVERTLVRLQAYENSFNTESYGPNQHGGFFKWSPGPATGTPPQVVIRNSTLRADAPALFGGNENGGLGLPSGSTCENVMLIGTEVWPDRDLQSWVDQCVGLTLGSLSDWNERVAAWDEEHPLP